MAVLIYFVYFWRLFLVIVILLTKAPYLELAHDHESGPLPLARSGNRPYVPAAQG